MNPLIEALKEMARVCVLAAIPIVIDGLSSGMVDWRLVAITAVIAALRFLDKWLHETGKEDDDDLMKGGLTRF